MKPIVHPSDRPRVRRRPTTFAALVVLVATGLVVPLSGAQAATTVPLGTVESFAILAGSTITNTGSSTVTGDVGLHPGTAVTGFGPGADAVTLNGSLHATDGVALQAKADLGTAYTNAAGQTPVTEIPTELGGSTLTAGVYDSAAGTFGVTGTLTLDGAGDPDSVFIFQMGSTLTTASASSVNVINGADLCNVFWQVGSSATLGSNSAFLGTIMADQSITLTTGASLRGRVLARAGAVTLDSNVISNVACATPAADGETPVDETPVDETPVDETPVDGTPVDGTPVDGTPVDEAPVDEAPVDGTPTDGETTSQIQDVPRGAVAAGGGGIDMAAGGRWSSPAGALALLFVGGGVGVIARRRARV